MNKLRLLFPVAMVLVIWHFLSNARIIDPLFFPSPLVIFHRLLLLGIDPDFLVDLRASSFRFFIALIIALVSALILTFICSHSKKADQFFNPLVAMSFPLPKVALMPLFLVLLGIDNASKIALISLGMFFLIFVQLRKAMLTLRQKKYCDLLQVYQISGSNYFYHVLLKGIYPDFLLGLKTAMTYGLTLVVVSEMSVSQNGIGHFIWRSWDAFNVVDMYAAISLLSVVGIVIYFGLDSMIKKSLRTYR